MIKIEQIAGNEIYSFTVGESISEADSQEFLDFLELHADDGNKIHLIGIIKSFPGFENFKAFSATMKLKAKAISAIGKYALLTDKSWLDTAILIGDFLIPQIPMKQFHLNEQDAAVEWLKGNN